MSYYSGGNIFIFLIEMLTGVTTIVVSTSHNITLKFVR